MKKIFAISLLSLFFMFNACKKDNENPPPTPPKVTDVDGNVYNSVVIGSQTWMKENLKTTRYRDSTAIPTGLDSATWRNTTSGAYTIYDNDTANNTIYGKLYNWYAVADPRNLCPTGWHVPTDAEFTQLTDYLGGEAVAGGKMKATTLWNSPNEGATNSSGFSALPGGLRNNYGNYNNIGDNGYFWSATESTGNSAWDRYLYFSYIDAPRYDTYQAAGFSVRCVKD